MAKMRRMLRWRGCEGVAVVFVSSHLLLATLVFAKKHGIGCMALQFIVACRVNCTTNNTLHCAPSEDDLTEISAPNCGVELPTFGSIAGRTLGCHCERLKPSEVFLQVIAADKNCVSLLKNRTNTEVGIGLVNSHNGGTLYWCLLFSSDRVNSTFVLEDHGVGIKQKTDRMLQREQHKLQLRTEENKHRYAHFLDDMHFGIYIPVDAVIMIHVMTHDYGTMRIPNARVSSSGRNKANRNRCFWFCGLLLAFSCKKEYR